MARGDDGDDKPKRGGAPAKFEGLRAGTTILKEDPFACILYSRYRKIRCDHCFKKYVNPLLTHLDVFKRKLLFPGVTLRHV